ncbi:hypothetical protein HanIR_Chr12g0602811 [Helianthus annuus]|nr:hypothetical protein HanIR_Chr12g0602811 [Helianthus annuus]
MVNLGLLYKLILETSSVVKPRTKPYTYGSVGLLTGIVGWVHRFPMSREVIIHYHNLNSTNYGFYVWV